MHRARSAGGSPGIGRFIWRRLPDRGLSLVEPAAFGVVTPGVPGRKVYTPGPGVLNRFGGKHAAQIGGAGNLACSRL